jgi:hypothetical protein
MLKRSAFLAAGEALVRKSDRKGAHRIASDPGLSSGRAKMLITTIIHSKGTAAA